MLKRMYSLQPACLPLLLTLVFAACGAPVPTTTLRPSVSGTLITATPAVILTDLNGPDDLKAQFNADNGVPRLILLVSPT